MKKGYVGEIDFVEGFLAQKYWSFPSSYSQEKKQTELDNILYSNDYMAATKMDGYFERIVKDEEGNIFMCSRNKGVNGVVEKHEWVPHLQSFFDELPKGTVLLGEVYLPNKTSKNIVSILGCLKDKAIQRQIKDEDKLRLYIFDVLYFDHTNFYSKPMEKRAKLLDAMSEQYKHHTFVEVAKYWDNPEDIRENWLKIIAQGGEGIVMTRKDYPYEFNKRTARKTLKLKKELEETIDVFLTGNYTAPNKMYTGKHIESHPYWFDEATEQPVHGTLSQIVRTDTLTPVTKGFFYGWAGSIEIALMKDGKVVPIGLIASVTEDVKKGIVSNRADYVGKVVELQCMEIDRSGDIPTLRHAKIERWRDDKDYKDCTWEQIM